MIVLPSDHAMPDKEKFLKDLSMAVQKPLARIFPMTGCTLKT
jgi:mannose-1-phosphate guanylyltransferase